jgi:hypothetical protein
MNLCVDSPGSRYGELALFEGRLSAMDMASTLGVAIKNAAFEEEAEWRLVATDYRDYPAGTCTKYRAGAFGLTPYVELEPIDGAMPMHTVMLGPRLYDPRAMASATGLLLNHGYDVMPTVPDHVRVIHSAATYRGGEG